MSEPQTEPSLNAFEAFVQRIAAVPKEVVEQIEAQRVKRAHRRKKGPGVTPKP